MPTYISILRGINVSGTKKMIMADLKQHYIAIGFTDVVTYIQSGNVIFKSDVSADKLADVIVKKIQDEYGFMVPVIIRTHNEMVETLKHNIFLHERKEDITKLAVTFLESEAEPEKIITIERDKFMPDEFMSHGKEIYLFAPNGFGRSKLTNNFFENQLKVRATTRNIKTVNKLIELSV